MDDKTKNAIWLGLMGAAVFLLGFLLGSDGFLTRDELERRVNASAKAAAARFGAQFAPPLDIAPYRCEQREVREL